MKMYFLLKMEIFQPAMLVLPKGICPLHSPLQSFPACQGSFELGLYRAVEGISDKYGKVEIHWMASTLAKPPTRKKKK